MEQDNNVKVLKEVCKGVKMGLDAIEYVEDKVKDDTEFKKTIKHEYSMYNNILDKVNRAFTDYNEEPREETLKDKAFLWYGIQMNTLIDNTTSKIAELLMQGTNMGIIEGRRLLNKNTDLDTNVDKLLHDFVSFQEQSVERLKHYL